jgi:spore maturation protein A
MNLVWVAIMIVGLGIMLFTNVDSAFATILTGSEKAIALSLKLWAIYAIWLGLLKIVEETNLDKKIAKLLSPVIDFLMGETDSKTKNYIAINLTSNLLGMGNASTPSGIEGMAGLDKGSKYITTAMAMFFILNVTSLQLIPTTIISLRALHGSLNSNDIILPTLISTIASTLTGIILVKMCKKLFKKGDNNE